MDEHLVDDQLKEQRRREGENLQEEGGDEHIGQRLAIAPDGRQEPAETKRLRLDPSAAETTRDEDDAAVPKLDHFVRADDLGDAVDRIDDPERIRRWTRGQYGEAAA